MRWSVKASSVVAAKEIPAIHEVATSCGDTSPCDCPSAATSEYSPRLDDDGRVLSKTGSARWSDMVDEDEEFAEDASDQDNFEEAQGGNSKSARRRRRHGNRAKRTQDSTFQATPERIDVRSMLPASHQDHATVMLADLGLLMSVPSDVHEVSVAPMMGTLQGVNLRVQFASSAVQYLPPSR